MPGLIKSSSALRAVFDQVSLRIENLVAEQIAEVSSKDLIVKVDYLPKIEVLLLTSVKAILLVGGFGENKYLYDRLQGCHASDNIQVMQVNGAFVFRYPSLILTLVMKCADGPRSAVERLCGV